MSLCIYTSKRFRWHRPVKSRREIFWGKRINVTFACLTSHTIWRFASHCRDWYPSCIWLDVPNWKLISSHIQYYCNMLPKRSLWHSATQYHISGVLCHKQVWGAGRSNCIQQYLWDVITCPCPSNLPVTQHLIWRIALAPMTGLPSVWPHVMSLWYAVIYAIPNKRMK